MSFVSFATASEQLKTTVSVCENFGCKSTAAVYLISEHWKRVEQHFIPEPATPVNERRAIADAVAEFEKIVGSLTITGQDKGGNTKGIGLPGQLDCISESTNTTHYLELLQERQLLRWHKPGIPAYRRPYVFDQHWSATIKLINGGSVWAVDSWQLDNGRRPFVQPLAAWYAKEALPYNPDAQ